MKTLTISLPDTQATKLEQDVALFGYKDAGEYISELLSAEQESLKELLTEGINSGEPMPVSAAFWTEFHVDTDTLVAEFHRDENQASAA